MVQPVGSRILLRGASSEIRAAPAPMLTERGADLESFIGGAVAFADERRRVGRR